MIMNVGFCKNLIQSWCLGFLSVNGGGEEAFRWVVGGKAKYVEHAGKVAEDIEQ